MKYFIDTEFTEGPHTSIFGYRHHAIQLVSIGIVAEDGREYYAINDKYNPRLSNDFVKNHVIPNLNEPFLVRDNWEVVCDLGSYLGSIKTISEIKTDINQFICPFDKASEYAGAGSIDEGFVGYLTENPPEFYGYYSDYDWVVFCSIYGSMVNLPKPFPKYCRDLKQMIDDAAELIRQIGIGTHSEGNKSYPKNPLQFLKSMNTYPKESYKHNALLDARWNKELYKFIKSL